MFAISQISTRDRIYKKLLDFVRNQFKLKDYYDKEGGWTRETVQIIWKTTKKYDWLNNILDEIERSNNKNKITSQTNKCSRKEREPVTCGKPTVKYSMRTWMTWNIKMTTILQHKNRNKKDLLDGEILVELRKIEKRKSHKM